MRNLSFSVLFDWDNSGNFDFDETDYVVSVGGDESMSPPGEGAFSGNGYVTEISVSLVNTGGRFSVNNSLSPLFSYINNGGFLQRKVIVGITLDGLSTVLFRGYVKSIDEEIHTTSKVGTVNVKCRSQDDIYKGMQSSSLASITKNVLFEQYDESEIIKRILEAAGLVDNIHFRSQAYSNPTLDRGLFVIPYFWLDKESPIEDCWLLANACSGRFFYNANDGLLYYKNAFEYGKERGGTSQATLTESNVADFTYESIDQDLIESVSVTARPRYITDTQEIWTSEKPIRIYPSETITIDADINNPIVEYNSNSYTLTSASGQLVTSGITVVPTVYSQSIKFQVTNSTNRLLFLRNFTVLGRQLEPLDNIDYARTSSSSFWSTRNGSEKKINANAYVQTFAQAKSLGDIVLDRQSQFSPKMRVSRYKGSTVLKLGDRVTVNITNRVPTSEFIITSVKWSLSSSGFYQDFELLKADGLYGLSTTSYFIIGTHKETDNKKLFY